MTEWSYYEILQNTNLFSYLCAPTNWLQPVIPYYTANFDMCDEQNLSLQDIIYVLYNSGGFTMNNSACNPNEPLSYSSNGTGCEQFRAQIESMHIYIRTGVNDTNQTRNLTSPNYSGLGHYKVQ